MLAYGEKWLYCFRKSMGDNEEEEEGAVLEVIRKPDPRLVFKGNWDLSAVHIDQSGMWPVSLVLERMLIEILGRLSMHLSYIVLLIGFLPHSAFSCVVTVKTL